MSLTVGARLGSFEVISFLGAGGMGEVYRARDTRLNRDVALKVLPASVSGDAERVARLTREAQLLASLNHHNIASIHGLEDADGVRALVLELVEGPTLADRIAHGPIPLDEALAIARQILDALEAAHEHGVVHRDLKPANIKVRPDGTIKVLDFGLAKALEGAASAGGASGAGGGMGITQSPTLSMQATQAGLILGTAAYMSPEQAAGKSADKRSDLWSFGVVLIETLTGRQPFTGETVPHVLASVLKGEPDWASLPPQTPVPIRRLLRRCLEKDRKRRLDSAAAARLEIEEASSAELPTATTMRTRLPWIAIAAVAGGAVTGALAWVLVRPPIPAPRPPSRFVISPGGTLTANQFDRVISISADGRQLLYIVAGAGTGTGGQLTVRALDQLDPRPLPGVTNARSPFSSPDGRWVGYFQGTELRKAPLAGGPTALLCAVTGAPRGAIWADDGTVVFATNDPTSGLLRVGSGGGEPVQLTTPRVSDGEGDHWFPSALPDSRGLLFTIAVPGQPDRSEVAVYDAQTGQYRRILRGSQAQYVQSGHVLYIAAGSLWAVHFDLTTLQVSGDPLPVIEGVRTAVQTGAADYQVSHSGALAYVPAGPPAQRSLAWVDRSGSEETIKAPPRAYVLPRLSPDGTRIALDVRDQENDIWILSLTGDATPRRLTYGPSVETNPVWIDNSRLVYTSSRSGRLALYSQAADGSGTPQQVTESGNGQYATTITRDATAVVGHQDGPTVFDIVLFTIPQPGQAAPPVKELVKTPSFEFNADISPNGRYLAYQSNESGPFQVIVRPFPDVDSGRWTVSPVEGSSPLWSRDGKELFYRDESDRIVAVPVETSGNTFRWGVPRQLFEFRGSTTVPNRSFDVSVDGRRFLVVNDAASTRAADIVLVLDWLEDLKAKVPVK